MTSSPEQVSYGPSLFGIDVSLGDESCLEQLGEGECIPRIGLDLGASDHVEAEGVSKRDVVALFLEAIDEPVPVECALDDDLHILLEWLDEVDDP